MPKIATFYSSLGNLTALKWLYDHSFFGAKNGSTICRAAARAGHFDILIWAHDNNFTWDEETTSAAAEGGHLSILQYLVQKGCTLNSYSYIAAKLYNRKEVLDWIDSINGPTHKEAIEFLEAECYLVDLKRLREEGCGWDECVCALSAGKGDLQLLKVLRDSGLAWDEHTCASAAKYGHLDVLKWAREHNCPWDHKTIAYAEENGYSDIADWAIVNGCTCE